MKSLNGNWKTRQLWISFLSWLPPSSPKIDTHNKTTTAIWIKFQTFPTGSLIASHFMQAISLLRKCIRMEIHRKVCIVRQRGKSVPVLYQFFRGRGFLPPSWKNEAGRNVGQAGSSRGVASRQRWNNCFCALFHALPLQHCKCSQIWKSQREECLPTLKLSCSARVQEWVQLENVARLL